jgi:mannose-6-phosphate isomerase-like protein (cupin superfamily)
VPAGHLLGVKVKTAHRVVGGQGPIESFSIRIPGNKDDKVVVQKSQGDPHDSWFLLDLHAPCADYQAGACLPPTNPAYSPWWDFWSGWQQSLITWHGQELHYHTRAEEYYIVLQGRLDLEVEGQVVPVQPGYLLGVKPGAVHGVIGGQEPIDTLFFRVPGGRGDKIVSGSRRLLID